MTAISDERKERVSTAARLYGNDGSDQSWQQRYSRWLVYADLIGVALAVGLAQWLRFGGLPGTEQTYRYSNYFWVSLLIGLGWMAALGINRSRSPQVIGSGIEEYRRVWVGTLATFGGIAIVSVLFRLQIARGYLMIALPTGLILLVLLRWLARQVLLRLRVNRGLCVTRVLVVGTAQAARDFACSVAREPSAGFVVVGACVPGSAASSTLVLPGGKTIPIFGDERNILEAVTATESRAVAITATERLHGRGIRDLSWQLEKLDVDLIVSPGVVDVAGPRLQMRPVAGLPLIHLEKPRYHGAKRFQKRLFDVAFAGAALLFTMPLLASIAVAIKLTSKGPIFYRQERVGLDGQTFDIIKFRTMVVGADAMLDELAELNESEGGVLFKIRDDPRVTVVGRYLRRYSLDELPQFLNVLKRDMSVVGPRPPLSTEVNAYDDYARRRLLVRPGITGLWQVSGRSDLSWEDSVRLDLFYVENWSMITDFLIALKTARVVFSRSGAY